MTVLRNMAADLNGEKTAANLTGIGGGCWINGVLQIFRWCVCRYW